MYEKNNIDDINIFYITRAERGVIFPKHYPFVYATDFM